MEQELRRRHHQQPQQKNLNNKKHRKKRRSTAEDYIDDEEDADYVEEEFGSSSGRRTTTKTRRKKRPKETTEIMPTWKLCAVGAAIFLCFALLYPSVFSPMLGSLFGSRRAAEEAGTSRTVHPSMVGPNPSGGPREPKPPGRQMHPGPAAMPQMQQAQTGTGGGSRGGFAWLLPFYTVGVVCFLLYTLFKVKFKRKTKQQQQKNRRNNSSNFWEDGGDESASDTYGANGGQKLRAVQSRLRKTEMAMQEILQQLELLAAQSQQFTQPMATANVGNAGGDGVAADGPPAQAVPEEPTSGEETASNRTTNQNAGGAGGGLSAEQTSMMEQRLKELKLLSALCKRDQKLGRRLRDHSSTEEEEESEDEEDALVDDEEAEDGEEEVGSQTEEEDEEAEENESELEQSNNKDEQRHKSD